MLCLWVMLYCGSLKKLYNNRWVHGHDSALESTYSMSTFVISRKLLRPRPLEKFSILDSMTSLYIWSASLTNVTVRRLNSATDLKVTMGTSSLSKVLVIVLYLLCNPVSTRLPLTDAHLLCGALPNVLFALHPRELVNVIYCQFMCDLEAKEKGWITENVHCHFYMHTILTSSSFKQIKTGRRSRAARRTLKLSYFKKLINTSQMRV